MLDTSNHICNISMHILSRSLPKKSPLHRGNDSAFKNAEHTQTHAYTRAHTQTNERTNEQTNKQTNISKIRCRLLQQTLTVRRWLKDLRNRWMPKTTQSKAQQKQSNPQKKANKQLGTAHREISPCWPTPRPRRSPQSPEQQQGRRKDHQ